MSSGYMPSQPSAAPPPGVDAVSGPPPLDAALEAAHVALRRAASILENDVPPVIDLSATARAFGDAFASLYDAIDRRDDPLQSVLDAKESIASTREAMRMASDSDPSFAPIVLLLTEALARLDAAEGRLAIVPAEIGDDPPALLVSVDLPRLHALLRPSLAPLLSVPLPPAAELVAAPLPPIPKPTTFEELADAVAVLKERAAKNPMHQPRKAPDELPRSGPPELPYGFAAMPAPPMSDDAFVQARTRECFEEVAMVGMQRAPLLGDPWRSALLLEQRMLASIDVIAGLGTVAVDHVPRLCADAPVKDPTRGFALAMILGCLRGRDALGAIEHAMWDRDVDDLFLGGIAEALMLVPHDGLSLALRSWLEETDPLLRALALRVLAYRGLATPAELERAAADHPLVAAQAFVPLALAPTPSLPSLIEAASQSTDSGLKKAVWTARMLTAHPHTEGVLFEGLSSEEGETAALLLAIGSDEGDARTLIQRAFEAPTRPLVTAVGWAGAVSSIGPLIALLEGDADEDVRFAAAYALDRITDAGMWEETPIQAEDIEVADPPEPDVGETKKPKLAAVVSDGRDRPAEPAPETVDQPTIDPEKWRAYWATHGASYDLRGRARRGKPYSAAVVLRELDVARAAPVERRWLIRELALRTGEVVRIDPHDFVRVQEEALALWRPRVERVTATGWGRAARRSR